MLWKLHPKRKNGETHINVVINLFTKFVCLYPVKGCTAENLSISVWTHWCQFGHTDIIISDMGPDLNSKLFAELVKLMGMSHKFSIQGRHINGCERVIKEVNRHLRAITYDTRIKDVFEDPTIIPTVQHILNSHQSPENAGFSPFELTFGTKDKIYANILGHENLDNISHNLLIRLNDNLRLVRKVSRECQEALTLKNEISNTSVDKINYYQPGDFVMYYTGPKPHPKLATRYRGPHEVINQYKNDVEVRNILTGAVTKFSTHDLKPFFGTLEVAKEAAMRDNDQYEVTEIIGYTGDSTKRTAMTFHVRYVDGDILKIPWTADLLCEAYYNFCESKPFLKHLAMDTKMAQKFQVQLRKTDITMVVPGDHVYVNLRFFGDLWYEQLGLPDYVFTTYVVEFHYTHWYHKSSRKRISAKFLLGGNSYSLDSYQVYAWGSIKSLDPAVMTLCDLTYLQRHPKLIE